MGPQQDGEAWEVVDQILRCWPTTWMETLHGVQAVSAGDGSHEDRSYGVRMKPGAKQGADWSLLVARISLLAV